MAQPHPRGTRLLEIKSTEARVYEALRAEIVRGLEPGAPLRLTEIATRYGVSTMPVRTALRRLETDGLVRGSARRGHVVAPVDLADLEEIQAIRAGVEGYAARLGAARIAEPGLKRMRTLLERLQAMRSDGTNVDRYLATEHAFRNVCYEASGRRRLVELVQTSRRAADRYIHIAIASVGGVRGSLGYQDLFMDACERRNGADAERITRDALGWTIATIAPILTGLQKGTES